MMKLNCRNERERRVELITQRSVVQIHPPQPDPSTNYGHFSGFPDLIANRLLTRAPASRLYSSRGFAPDESVFGMGFSRYASSPTLSSGGPIALLGPPKMS